MGRCIRSRNQFKITPVSVTEMVQNLEDDTWTVLKTNCLLRLHYLNEIQEGRVFLQPVQGVYVWGIYGRVTPCRVLGFCPFLTQRINMIASMSQFLIGTISLMVTAGAALVFSSSKQSTQTFLQSCVCAC